MNGSARKGRALAAVLILAGLALAALSWLLAPTAFGHGWVAALFTLLGWPLGSMALLLIHALTGGRWGEAIRTPLLLGVLVLPLALLGLIPVAVLLPSLYTWTNPGVADTLYNSWWLNIPFLGIRVAVELVVWLVLAALTVLGALGRGPALARIAPAGLILLAITATAASIDLTEALDPTFSSSIYGMLTGTGMTLFALAVAILLGLPTASRKSRNDLAKLMLALCILWTYLDFAQFLVIWNSNLASDAPWLTRRTVGFWAWSLGALWLVHALGAVLLLGVPGLRSRLPVLGGFAVAVILLRFVRAWWLVLPGIRMAPGWADAGCMAGLFAIAAGLLWLLSRLAAFRAEARHA